MQATVKVLKSKYCKNRIKEARSYLESANSMIQRDSFDIQTITNVISQLNQAASELEQLRGACLHAHSEGDY